MKKQPSKVAHNSQPAIFFFTGLAAQKAHFRQKWELYRLSVSPLYNLVEYNTFHARTHAHLKFVHTIIVIDLFSSLL
jgi:hypothetical protein